MIYEEVPGWEQLPNWLTFGAAVVAGGFAQRAAHWTKAQADAAKDALTQAKDEAREARAGSTAYYGLLRASTPFPRRRWLSPPTPGHTRDSSGRLWRNGSASLRTGGRHSLAGVS